MIDLKKCPFCGHNAVSIIEYIDEPATAFDIIRKVGCEGCGIYFNGHLAVLPSFDPIGAELCEKELAEKWNRRT